MPKAYRSHQAPVQKLTVIGQVREFKPGPSYHPLDLLHRWVERGVGHVLENYHPLDILKRQVGKEVALLLIIVQPWNAYGPGPSYRPQHESN